MDTKYLRVNDTAEFLAVSRATIYRWIKSNPNFPKSIQLGERSTVFDLDELKAFVAHRKEQSAVLQV